MEQIKSQLLPGKYIGFYPKFNEEKGESYDVFKYALTGTKEALAEYERITLEKGIPCHKTEGLMGEYGVPDGLPIFFGLDFSGDEVEIKITVNGKIVLNDEILRQIQSMARRTTGIIQKSIAEEGVKMLLGQMFKKNKVSAFAPVDQDVEQEVEHESVEPMDADFGKAKKK